MYANHRGCDGNRLYFDGSAMIALNDKLLVQADQFGMKDVEVHAATINLDEVRRNTTSLRKRKGCS